MVLVAANLVPLFGAIFLGWRVFDIVFLYWAENLVVGAINVLRILSFPGGSNTAGAWLAKIFTTGFFIVHYGIFCAVHGVFVFALLGDDSPFGAMLGLGAADDLAMLPGFSGFVGLYPHDAMDRYFHLGWAILALAVSHLFSFVVNFRRHREFDDRKLNEQMMAPYPRMVALHIAIVFGAFGVQALGQPLFLLVILVVGKTIVDWRLHLRSHRQ